MWWCCSNSGCALGEDDFSSFGTLSTSWVAESGDWYIPTTGANSGQLITSDADAYIKFDTPNTEPALVVFANIYFDTDGDKAGIRLSDTLYAELEYNNSCETGYRWDYPLSPFLGDPIQSEYIGCSFIRLYDLAASSGNKLLVEKRIPVNSGCANPNYFGAGYSFTDSYINSTGFGLGASVYVPSGTFWAGSYPDTDFHGDLSYPHVEA